MKTAPVEEIKDNMRLREEFKVGEWVRMQTGHRAGQSGQVIELHEGYAGKDTSQLSVAFPNISGDITTANRLLVSNKKDIDHTIPYEKFGFGDIVRITALFEDNDSNDTLELINDEAMVVRSEAPNAENGAEGELILMMVNSVGKGDLIGVSDGVQAIVEHTGSNVIHEPQGNNARYITVMSRSTGFPHPFAADPSDETVDQPLPQDSL